MMSGSPLILEKPTASPALSILPPTATGSIKSPQLTLRISLKIEMKPFENLLQHVNLPAEKLSGMLVLSLKDNAVIHVQDIADPTDKANMCLSMLSASTELAQSFEDDPVRLLRLRTEPHEYFIICGMYNSVPQIGLRLR